MIRYTYIVIAVIAIIVGVLASKVGFLQLITIAAFCGVVGAFILKILSEKNN